MRYFNSVGVVSSSMIRPPAPDPGALRVHTDVSPVLAQTFTEPFIVYSAKRFPGVPGKALLLIELYCFLGLWVYYCIIDMLSYAPHDPLFRYHRPLHRARQSGTEAAAGQSYPLVLLSSSASIHPSIYPRISAETHVADEFFPPSNPLVVCTCMRVYAAESQWVKQARTKAPTQRIGSLWRRVRRIMNSTAHQEKAGPRSWRVVVAMMFLEQRFPDCTH